MMKATELRIGNWVSIGNKDQTIDLHIQFDFDEGGWYVDDMNIDNVRPIPLTEEWLVKLGVPLGFETFSNNYMIEDTIDAYCVRLSYDVGMSKFIAETKYVHQLQNLYFALTGEEL